MLLNVLPDNQAEWLPLLEEERRRYGKLKDKHIFDPREMQAEDANLLHPLALEEEVTAFGVLRMLTL